MANSENSSHQHEPKSRIKVSNSVPSNPFNFSTFLTPRGYTIRMKHPHLLMPPYCQIRDNFILHHSSFSLPPHPLPVGGDLTIPGGRLNAGKGMAADRLMFPIRRVKTDPQKR